jgi:hypothetical protein
MTECEWLTAVDPQPMLDWLASGNKLSGRSARLFAAACCRRVWGRLTAERHRRAVETAERYADGKSTPDELRHAAEVTGWMKPAEAAAHDSVSDDPAWAAREAARHASWAVGAGPRAVELEAQAALLRCIFGPRPFRPLPPAPATWLAWNGGTVKRIAETIYEQRRFLDLPILADPLEDAGCADAALLEHLRGPGPHCRGCWALDLVPGKG